VRAYCEVTGQLLPRRYWEFEHEGRIVRARSPHCEALYLEYVLPRLAGSSTALSRLGGGIGTRGPGETKLETDRRRIRYRIASHAR